MTDPITPAQAAQLKVAARARTAKTYYHQTPGARFIMQLGPSLTKDLVFYGGQYSTDIPEEIAELDKIANIPGTFIYTKTAVVDPTVAQGLAELQKTAIASANPVVETAIQSAVKNS